MNQAVLRHFSLIFLASLLMLLVACQANSLLEQSWKVVDNLTLQEHPVIFIPAPGAITGPQSVHLKIAYGDLQLIPDGLALHYTVDGSQPDRTVGQSYDPATPIILLANSSLKVFPYQAEAGNLQPWEAAVVYTGDYAKQVAGTIDHRFRPAGEIVINAASQYQGIESIALQLDGRILLAGKFDAVDNKLSSNLARINSDGSLDTTFNPDAKTAAINTYDLWKINQVLAQPDGKILAVLDVSAGQFLLRLNADGSLDTGFDGYAANSPMLDHVMCVALQSDGKILISDISGRVLRWNADGSADPGFVPNGNYDGWCTTDFALGEVDAIAVQADGKILIGGLFNKYNGVARNYLARLNTDGSLDTSFAPSGNGLSEPVQTIAVQADGKILVATRQNYYLETYNPAYNGQPFGGLCRLNADGSLDSSFKTDVLAAVGTTPAKINGIVIDAARNKILVSGILAVPRSIDNTAGTLKWEQKCIARLNLADGSLDSAFMNNIAFSGVNNNTAASSSFGIPTSILILPDGNYLVGGEFVTFSQVERKYLVKLLAD